ncbi:hypothetical protein GGE07_006549 [Sinorhizobium terangae]|uniref:Uncharacterized protein n=1 Tax=Sinorhizobium terangae TaxID=110322 RepID=A0A6N7LN45_SINTE|nr:hypothetical protein [Sinorhizobium terangae]MBB4189843.1 hypothetical protein [Sinorhizobium terangae]MQX18649.1 hypothetical protein [Sinorhizobium terangae]
MFTSFYCLASELRASFLVRIQTDRLGGTGDHTVAAVMANEPPCAAHVVEIWNDKDVVVTVTLGVKFRATHVRCWLGWMGRKRRPETREPTITRLRPTTAARTAVRRSGGGRKAVSQIDPDLIVQLPPWLDQNPQVGVRP